jgi:proteasome lid subunit RPN8/RPN11
MSSPRLLLTLPRRLEREFKRYAKTVYPREACGFLLGTVAGSSVTIDEFWYPDREEVAKFSTPTQISGEGWTLWLVEATEYARENDLRVCGDIHVHPNAIGVLEDRVPSETDLDTSAKWSPLVTGICTVALLKGGRLRASVRWHGPMVPVEVKYV